MKFIICIICFSFIFWDTYSQKKEIDFLNITQAEGLPSNETYCVFKDSKNYMWIATDQGIVRSNGLSLQFIDNLPDNVVFKIKEDSKGRIWFFSRTHKLAYFFNEKVHIFQFNDSIQKRIDPSYLFLDAVISKDDIISMKTRPNSNFDININTGVIKEQQYNFDVFTTRFVMSIYAGGGEECFTKKISAFESNVSEIDVYVINAKDTIFYPVKFKMQEKTQFYNSFKDKEGNVFLFMGKLIIKLKPDGSYMIKEIEKEVLNSCYNKKTNSFLFCLRGGGIMQLSANLDIVAHDYDIGDMSATSITFDFEGSCWITTLENGVYYFKNKIAKKLVYETVSHVLEHNGDLYFAKKEGVYKWTGKEQTTPLIAVENKHIWDIKVDSAGNILLAGAFAQFIFPDLVSHYKSGKHTLLFSSTELSQTKSNDYAYRVYNRVVIYNHIKKTASILDDIGKQTPVPIPYMGNLFIDKNEKLWLTGFSNLYRYDSSAKKFNAIKDAGSYFSKGITCMRQMDNGILAVGTRFNGIVLMRDTVIINHITEADNLKDNSVKYMLVLKDKLWLATSKGLSVIQFSSYKPLKYTVKNFGEEVGLNNCIIYQFIQYNNTIIAATSKGLLQLSDITELVEQKPLSLPLYITNINYNKRDTSNVSSIELPYSNNGLSVNFTGLCYNAPKTIMYYYRLNNSDDTLWRSINTTQLIFEKIEPGNYELQIKAAIPEQDRYSQIQSLKITIHKPWWQLNVIRILFVIFVVGLLLLFYNRRIKVIRKKQLEKLTIKYEIVELKQTALRAQMNPHFIFNCLTSIQQILMYGNKNEANEYLVRFSRLIRKTLELSNLQFATIEQEKEYLEEYLKLEQLRIPGKINYSFIISNTINPSRVLIPNMMLQPIIENSIRHGIKHLRDRQGEILIEIDIIDDCLRITVTDNGIGRNKEDNEHKINLVQHKSFGIDIVTKILYSQTEYNSNKHFLITEDVLNDDNLVIGTKVILQMPLKTIQ